MSGTPTNATNVSTGTPTSQGGAVPGDGKTGPPPKRFLGVRGAIFMAIYLAAVGFFLVQNMYAVWPPHPPAVTPAGADSLQAASTDTFDVTLSFFGLWNFPLRKLTWDQLLMLVTVFMGALGSWVHATSSFVTFRGNRTFVTSWTWWYVLRPLIGSGLALVFYVVLRAGLVTAQGGTVDINHYSVAAYAALVGLFTERATKKLADVFDVLFMPRQKDTDALEGHPKPSIRALEPSEIEVSSANRQLQIDGEGFVSESTVLIDGKPRATEYESATRIVATLTEEDVAAEGDLEVSVRNPEPGGGESDKRTLRVSKPGG